MIPISHQSQLTPGKSHQWDAPSTVDYRNSMGMPFNSEITQSPMSDELDKELHRQFASFSQIDELVSKQEELYNQIAMLQSTKNFSNAQDMKVKGNNSAPMTKMQQRKASRNNVQQSSSRQGPFPHTVASIQDASLMSNLQEDQSVVTQMQMNQAQNLLLSSLSSNDAQNYTYMQSYSGGHQQSEDFQQNNAQQQQQLNFYEQHILEQQQKHIQSVSSQKSIKNKPLQVTERLLTIGKMYEAKREKLKQHYEQQRQAQEESIVSQVKNKYAAHESNRSIGNGKQMPVEQRLYDIKKKYDMNAERRKQAIKDSELEALKNPQINSRSERLLQNNQSYSSALKVEDRLLEVGKKWKEKKDTLIQSYYEQADHRAAHPTLTISSQKQVTHPQKRSKSPQPNHHKEKSCQNITGNKMLKTFEERLKDQMDKKEKMLADLKKKYEGEIVNQTGDKKTLHEFDQRQLKFEDQKRTNQFKVVYIEQSKCTFKPKINENSRKLIQSQSRERLITPNKHHTQCKTDRFSKSPGSISEVSQSQKNDQNQNTLNTSRPRSKTPNHRKQSEPQFTFHPSINDKSRQMVQKQLIIQQSNDADNLEQQMQMKSSDQDPQIISQPHSLMVVQEPRWKLLYNKHNEINQKKDLVAKQLHNDQIEREKEQCTFKPHIDETRDAQQNLGQVGEIVQRNQQWFLQRQQKLQLLNELQKKEEVDSCTFHPQVIVRQYISSNQQKKGDLKEALQADYSQLNTKSIEKYLERCTYAKQLKVEKELLHDSKFGSGSKWKNKVTKAQAPSFMRDYYQQIKALSPSPMKQSRGSYSAMEGNAKRVDISSQESEFRQHLNRQNSDIQMLSEKQYSSQVQEQETPYLASQQTDQNPIIANYDSFAFPLPNQVEIDDNKGEFESALNFLHQQLHKIEFSFDQHQ